MFVALLLFFILIWASTLAVLNSYITIFSTVKYQNVPYNGGAKAIFFCSIVTVPATFDCALQPKGIKKKFIICTFTLFLIISLIFILSFIFISLLQRSHCYCLCIHTSFTRFFFFFNITFTRLYIMYAFTLLLFFYSYILSFLIYCFFICAFTLLL